MRLFVVQFRFALVGLVGAAFVVGGCSSTAVNMRPKNSTSFSISVPGTAIDQTRVPLPNEMHQKVGLGEHFRVAVTSAHRVGNVARIGINVFYSGVGPLALVDLASHVSLRDGLFGRDLAATKLLPNYAHIAPGQSVDIVLTFDTSGPFKKMPTLYLRGAALPGALPATFNITFE